MSEASAGPVPAEISDWLAGRRVPGPLPEGDLVRYERISRGKGDATNVVITVSRAGTATAEGPVVEGSGHVVELDDGQIEALTAATADLDGEAPYQRDTLAKGGDWEIVTWSSGPSGSVIFENAERPVLRLLRHVADDLVG